VIILCDEILKWRKAAFRAPVLAAAVGIYLPLELSVPIFLGGVLAAFVARQQGDPENQQGHAVCRGASSRRVLGGRADRHSDRGHAP